MTESLWEYRIFYMNSTACCCQCRAVVPGCETISRILFPMSDSASSVAVRKIQEVSSFVWGFNRNYLYFRWHFYYPGLCGIRKFQATVNVKTNNQAAKNTKRQAETLTIKNEARKFHMRKKELNKDCTTNISAWPWCYKTNKLNNTFTKKDKTA